MLLAQKDQGKEDQRLVDQVFSISGKNHEAVRKAILLAGDWAVR